MIELFQIGSPVYIGNNIEARIAEISIRDKYNIVYKVVWFDGQTRKIEWLEQFEINSHPQQDSFKIGFKHCA